MLFIMFSGSFYLINFILAFRWDTVNKAIIDGWYSYNNENFTLFVLLPLSFYAGVYVLTRLFSNSNASEYIVKIVFFTSLLSLVFYSFHLIATGVTYVLSESAVESVLGYNPEMLTLTHFEELLDTTRLVLREKAVILSLNLTAVIGFLSLILKSYFKRMNKGFVQGIKYICDLKRFDQYIAIYKELK